MISEAVARLIDDATVVMLRRTSPPMVRVAVEYEERNRIPAYDHDAERIGPRDRLVVCAAPDCCERFWVRPQGRSRLYCCHACKYRTWYRSQSPEARRTYNAERKARRRAEQNKEAA